LRNWNASKSKNKVHMHYINYINNRPAGDVLPMGKKSQGRKGAFNGFMTHRDLIYAAHGDCCAVCDQSRKDVSLTLHHIEPIGIFHNNDIANIIPVCVECHKELHRTPAMFDNALIKLTV